MTNDGKMKMKTKTSTIHNADDEDDSNDDDDDDGLQQPRRRRRNLELPKPTRPGTRHPRTARSRTTSASLPRAGVPTGLEGKPQTESAEPMPTPK